jgi:hypothetical protein
VTPATPAQQKNQIRRIVKEWAGRLALGHYEISVEWDEEPDNEDAYASVEVSELYDQATIRFRKDFPEHDIFLKNRIVAHELIHILFHRYGMAVRSIGVTGCLSADARALWHDRCHDEEEATIDRIANRMVEIGGCVE